MTAIEEIHALIQKRRYETWREPTEMKVPVLLFEAAFHECRESMKTVDGTVPNVSVPDDYLLYGVKIVPGQTISDLINARIVEQMQAHDEKVLLGEATW